MKKRLMALVMAGLMVFSATACGDKDGAEGKGENAGKKEAKLELEDIQDSFANDEATSMEGSMDVSVDADLSVSNTSDTVDQMLEMVSNAYDIDLEDGVEVSASVSFEVSGLNNDDATYTTMSGELDIDSNVDMLNEMIEEELGDTSFEFEAYTDKDAEVRYTYNSVDDDWSEEAYEEGESADTTAILSALVNYCIVKNENADDDDKIEIYEEKEGYSLGVNLSIDNDYLSDMSDDELEALQEVLDTMSEDNDVDLEDLMESYEMVGDYVDIKAPLEITIFFTEEDDEYVINRVKFSFELKISGEWDEETINDILSEQGASLSDLGLSDDDTITVEFNASIKFNCDFEIGYDDVDIDEPDGI